MNGGRGRGGEDSMKDSEDTKSRLQDEAAQNLKKGTNTFELQDGGTSVTWSKHTK